MSTTDSSPSLDPSRYISGSDRYDRISADTAPITLLDVMDVLDKKLEMLEINADKPDGTSEEIQSLHKHKYSPLE
jgi:hypothetical protein